MSNFVRRLTLCVALLTACNSSAQTSLPRVVDINEKTTTVNLKVGDYVRVTTSATHYVLFKQGVSLAKGIPADERKSFVLENPDRTVSIFKILSREFDCIAINCWNNGYLTEYGFVMSTSTTHRVRVVFAKK